MYLNYFKLFGFGKYQMRFSTHDPAKLGEKFVDKPELWKKTEDMVRNVLIKIGHPLCRSAQRGRLLRAEDRRAGLERHRQGVHHRHEPGGFRRARERFGLKYKTRDNTEETPLCIHRAPLGTHERFIGFLIEHYAGNFPLWLSPEQVRVLPIGDEEPLVEYAQRHRQRTARAAASARRSTPGPTRSRPRSPAPSR